MSGPKDIGPLVQEIHASFQDAARSRFEREQFPVPGTPQEWRSWLTNEALMSVQQGVQTGDPAMFRNASTLLAGLRSIVSFGVAFSPAIPPLPDFLFRSDGVGYGVYTSHLLRPGYERMFQAVLGRLDKEVQIGLHIQEFCELAGVPQPQNMAQWCAVLIKMGCICIVNTKSFLNATASEEERSAEAEARAQTDLSEIDDAICVLRGVEQFVSYGIMPDPGVKMVPL